MKRILLIIALIMAFAAPVRALELTAPDVPKQAEKFMPSNQKSFGEGLLEVFQDALVYV